MAAKPTSSLESQGSVLMASNCQANCHTSTWVNCNIFIYIRIDRDNSRFQISEFDRIENVWVFIHSYTCFSRYARLWYFFKEEITNWQELSPVPTCKYRNSRFQSILQTWLPHARIYRQLAWQVIKQILLWTKICVTRLGLEVLRWIH